MLAYKHPLDPYSWLHVESNLLRLTSHLQIIKNMNKMTPQDCTHELNQLLKSYVTSNFRIMIFVLYYNVYVKTTTTIEALNQNNKGK